MFNDNIILGSEFRFEFSLVYFQKCQYLNVLLLIFFCVFWNLKFCFFFDQKWFYVVIILIFKDLGFSI